MYKTAGYVTFSYKDSLSLSLRSSLSLSLVRERYWICDLV